MGRDKRPRTAYHDAHPVAGADFFIAVSWTNFGKTPAFHVKRTFVADIKQPAIPLSPCGDCGDGEVMLPGIPVSATSHIAAALLTQAAADAITSKIQNIWLVGRIDYVDGGGAPHKTMICYNFNWDGSFISCDIAGSNYAD